MGLYAAACGVALAALASLASGPPPFLLNDSPSEPLGLYARSSASPRPGAIIAFRAPPAAFPYADRRMPYLRSRPLLKAIVATANDVVCTRAGVLRVNGVRFGVVASADGEGRPLPQWRGCRRLAADEVFVFSGRIRNSFDSRYYGPVNRAAVLGVYRLVAPRARGAA